MLVPPRNGSKAHNGIVPSVNERHFPAPTNLPNEVGTSQITRTLFDSAMFFQRSRASGTLRHIQWMQRS